MAENDRIVSDNGLNSIIAFDTNISGNARNSMIFSANGGSATERGRSASNQMSASNEVPLPSARTGLFAHAPIGLGQASIQSSSYDEDIGSSSLATNSVSARIIAPEGNASLSIDNRLLTNNQRSVSSRLHADNGTTNTNITCTPQNAKISVGVVPNSNTVINCQPTGPTTSTVTINPSTLFLNNVVTPTNPRDAANKEYVDSRMGGSNTINSPDGRTNVTVNNNELRANVDDANVLEVVPGSFNLSHSEDINIEAGDDINIDAADDIYIRPGQDGRVYIRHTEGTTQHQVRVDDQFTINYSTNNTNLMYPNGRNYNLKGVSTDVTSSNLFSRPDTVEGEGKLIRTTQDGITAETYRTLPEPPPGPNPNPRDYWTYEPFIAEQPADLTTKQYVDGAIEDRAFTRNPDGSIILSVINDEGVLVGSLSIGASGHGIFAANNSFGISAGGSTIGVDASGVRLNRIPFSTAEIQRLKELAGTTSD